ncbi:hypothetical protein LP416_03940 [Polaromonas sp. P2-4]|nr:hypothetical protein LP416_03940 [Polaromonas sp. P2-4]
MLTDAQPASTRLAVARTLNLKIVFMVFLSRFGRHCAGIGLGHGICRLRLGPGLGLARLFGVLAPATDSAGGVVGFFPVDGFSSV